jgi:plastocyanin
MPGPDRVVRNAPSDAVVWVETVPASADSSLAPRGAAPRLAQIGERFVPRVLPIAVGTAVDFPNLDPIYHNVFSLSPVRRFDLGKYARGHSKQVTFPRPGVVNVFCDIHSEMAAWIVVLPHRFFTQPDAQGRFELPPLPPGRYVLKVWHPDVPETRSEVVLVGATQNVEIEL